MLDCLKDIKTQMALTFLNFNESKTEVLIFSPSGISDMDLCSLEPYVKIIVKNLCYVCIMDSDFKQINVTSFLTLTDIERVIHAYIFSCLDYCNALYVG